MELFAADSLYRRPAIAEKFGGASPRKLDTLLAGLPRVELGSKKFCAYRGSDLNALVARGLKPAGKRALPTGACAPRNAS